MNTANRPYIGEFLYHYEGGGTYRLNVPNETDLHWECVKGSEVGAKGSEKPQRYEVANNVYFVTWIESTGVQISQALNFETNKVFVTISEGQDRYVLVGDIERVH